MPEHLVYHFTHLDNLPAVLAEGGLLADTAVPPGVLATEVGDADVKGTRRRRRVPAGPGGVVADYVPFYFAPRSPMLFRIARDHEDGVPGRYPDGEDPLVYLVSSVELVVASGRPWLATDGNAAVAVTRFSGTVAELATLVDWPLMQRTYWAGDAEDPDRERRRMAELLVHQRLPLTALRGFATRTTERARQVRVALAAAGRAADYVAVRPSWYHGPRRTGVNR